MRTIAHRHNRLWKRSGSGFALFRTVVTAAFLSVLAVQTAGAVVLFEDDFEGDFPGPWMLSNLNNDQADVNWGLNIVRAASGTHCVFCASVNADRTGRTYFNNLVNFMDLNLQTLNVDLDDYVDYTLTFKAWINTAEDSDFFGVSLLDTAWTTGLLVSGNLSVSGWQTYTIDFKDVADTTVVRLGFDFLSDSTVIPSGDAGVWIDDVVLTATPRSAVFDLAVENLMVDPMELVGVTQFSSVSMDIVNFSPNDFVNGDILLTYYLSQNSVFGDGDDVIIGDGSGAVTVNANSRLSITLTPQGLVSMTRLWPDDLPEGSYFVYAELSLVVDTLSDPDLTNNHDRSETAFNYRLTVAHSVTIETSPAGFPVRIDGTLRSTPYTFSVRDGDSFTLAIDEFQSAGIGARDRFESWSDGGAREHTVTPVSDTAIAATLVREYHLTMGTNTTAGGAVTPADDGWYPAGDSFSISASARTGWRFVEWIGVGMGSYSGTSNPATITMDGPITQTAYFEESPLVVNYQGEMVQSVPAANRALRVSFEGGTAGVTGTVFHRPGGQTVFTSATMTETAPGTLEYVLPASVFGIRGVEYYFEIEDGTTTVRLPGADSVYIFRTQLTGVQIVATSSQQYQMIGFPFTPSPASVSAIFDEVTDKSDAGWRFGRFNPATGRYDEFPALSTVARNNGYWLITKEGVVIQADGLSSVPDNLQGNNRFARITLQQGWNQVACPFAFEVAVSAVQFDVGVEPAFHEFVRTSGSYRTVSTLRPFQGYWIFNGGANNATIVIPYRQAGTSSVADTNTGVGTPESWSVSLTARSGDRADMDNRAGILREATDRYDKLDRSEPPVIGRFVSLSFESTRDGHSHELTHSFHAPSGDGDIYRFDVMIRSNTGAPVVIDADLSRLPPGYGAVLADRHNSRRYDLAMSPQHSLPPVPDGTVARYTLMVGTSEQLAGESETDTPIPDKFTLAQNYPNPFNAGTVISYILSDDADVTLTVFDVLGREVITLVNDRLEPGSYHTQWDGRDANGRAMASGMYFYRLSAGGRTDVRKMLLLK